MNQDDAARRIEDLEEQLRRAREEAARYKQAAFTFLEELVPYTPVTEEELHRLLTDTSGTPIRDIIAELERTQA